MKQQTLFKTQKTDFGGSLLLHKRREKRPIATKTLIHLVLKAETSNIKSLLLYHARIHKEISKWSEKFSVRIFEKAICGNHIHLSLMVFRPEDYKNFVRVLPGQLSQKFGVKWKLRPFTRLVKEGRASVQLNNYVKMNRLEAFGLRPYRD